MNEAPPAKRGGWWYGAAVFCVLVIGFFGFKSSIPGPETQKLSFQHMKEIASAMMAYESEHSGRLPDRLSQLAPYLKDTESFYFPCGRHSMFVPSHGDAEPRFIDIFSSYGFSPLSDGRAVVFERLPIWQDHSIGYCVITRSGSMQAGRVQPEEFQLRYLRDFR